MQKILVDDIRNQLISRKFDFSLSPIESILGVFSRPKYEFVIDPIKILRADYNINIGLSDVFFLRFVFSHKSKKIRGCVDFFVSRHYDRVRRSKIRHIINDIGIGINYDDCITGRPMIGFRSRPGPRFFNQQPKYRKFATTIISSMFRRYDRRLVEFVVDQ